MRCQCGRPALRAGQLRKGAHDFASACERCRRIELSQIKDEEETGRKQLRPYADQPEFSKAFARHVSAACDTFFARRGLTRGPVSSHIIHTL